MTTSEDSRTQGTDVSRFTLKTASWIRRHSFFTLAQLHQRALSCESRCKDTAKAVHNNIDTVDCNQSNSDDEPQEVYAAELVWPKQAKSLVCFSL
jgi:hypothetical protein